MQKAWPLILGGALVAPFVTWLPMLSLWAPRLGLPQYPIVSGIELWWLQAFYLVALGVLGTVIWRDGDPWLGMAVGLAGVTVFYRGATLGATLDQFGSVTLGPSHAAVFALGAVMLVAIRHVPGHWRHHLASLLAALGAFQVVYVFHQLAGYDVLWGRFDGGRLGLVQPIGTLAGVDSVSAYIAILAPLMPLWVLPFAIWVVWMGHSLSALLALLVGLCVRYRPDRHDATWTSVVIAGGAGLAFGSMLYLKGIATPAVASRFAIWKFGLQHAAVYDPVLGWGLGGWVNHVPLLQVHERFLPFGANELWREAHSEPIQWLTECGLIGGILLCGWLWTHRAAFVHPVWGGSVSALAANSLGFFPLHVVPISLVGLIVVGLATSRMQEAT